MATQTLARRIESLEQATGAGQRTVRLMFIGSGGEPLELGGSRCRARPSNDRLNLCIHFVTPEPRQEAAA